jgi:hypothetical protein
MIQIKVKIKHENKAYSEVIYVPEDFNVCKLNKEFQEKIDKIIRSVNWLSEDIRESRDFTVTISTSFEW